DQQRHAPILKTARQTAQQVDLALHLAQQQRPALAGHVTSREPGLHPARKMSCKLERNLVTLCHQRPLPFEAFSYVWSTQLCHENSGLLPLFLLWLFTPCLLPVRNAG